LMSQTDILAVADTELEGVVVDDTEFVADNEPVVAVAEVTLVTNRRRPRNRTGG